MIYTKISVVTTAGKKRGLLILTCCLDYWVIH